MHPEQDETRSIKTTDKLNYRAVIQDKIIEYLNAIGTPNLEQAVKALRNSVYFEIPGLPFRTEILAKEKELKIKRVGSILTIVKSSRDEWLHPFKRIINMATVDEKFYMEYGEFLLELVARYDGLIGVKGFVELGDSVIVLNEEGDK